MKRQNTEYRTSWEIFVDSPDVEILVLCGCSRHHVQVRTRDVGNMCDKKQQDIRIPCRYYYAVKTAVYAVNYQTCIHFLVGCPQSRQVDCSV